MSPRERDVLIYLMAMAAVAETEQETAGTITLPEDEIIWQNYMLLQMVTI